MYCDFLEFFVFVPRSSNFSVGRRKRYATSSHVQMTPFVNVCDVKSAKKRYACFKIVNNKTKMNKTCVSYHRCLGSPVVRKKEFRLEGFISLEEINLSRQKQNYGFYLFDKSWYLPAKHVIYRLYISFCHQSKASWWVNTSYKFRWNKKITTFIFQLKMV